MVGFEFSLDVKIRHWGGNNRIHVPVVNSNAMNLPLFFSPSNRIPSTDAFSQSCYFNLKKKRERERVRIKFSPKI